MFAMSRPAMPPLLKPQAVKPKPPHLSTYPNTPTVAMILRRCFYWAKRLWAASGYVVMGFIE